MQQCIVEHVENLARSVYGWHAISMSEHQLLLKCLLSFLLGEMFTILAATCACREWMIWWISLERTWLSYRRLWTPPIPTTSGSPCKMSTMEHRSPIYTSAVIICMLAVYLCFFNTPPHAMNVYVSKRITFCKIRKVTEAILMPFHYSSYSKV